MDDNSYSETNNETAPTTPPGAFVVAATNSNGTTTADASKFSGCYFLISGEGTDATWTLYNRNGNSLASGVVGASTFMFDHDAKKNSPTLKITWTTSSCNWTFNNEGDLTGVTGSWINTDDDLPTAGAQSGSFTASSGGAIDPVTASASA